MSPAVAQLRTMRARLAGRPAVQRLAALGTRANAARAVTAPPAGASGGVVQRYFRVDHNNLTAGAGAALPSQAIVDGVPTTTVKSFGAGGFSATTSRYDPVGRAWNAGAPVPLPAQPAMNVSAGAELAIEATAGASQATAFYGTAGAVATSNQLLQNAGSVVRLAASGQTITVPTNPDPGAFDATPKTLNRVEPAANIPNTHPSDMAGRPLLAAFGNSNCDDVVQQIIGKGKKGVVVGTGAHRQEVPYESFEPTDQIGGFLAANRGSQNVGALATAAAAPPAPGVDAAAQAGYQQETAHGEPHAALGLNRHAAPEVGEAFLATSLAHANTDRRGHTTFSTGAADDSDEYLAALAALATVGQHADIMQSAVTAAQKTLRAVWSNHYAGVVARDGADTVTMENYARSKERDWNILSTFNRLYANAAEFRAFVRTRTNALRSQNGDQLTDLIRAAQAESLQAGVAIHARRVELQAAVDAISPDVASLDSSMLHFRMYGPGAGQSFHDQFKGTMANPLTTTLRSSFAATRDAEVAETRTVCDAFIRAVSRRTGDAAIDGGLTTQAGLIDRVGRGRLQALQACQTVEDVLRIKEERRLRRLEGRLVAFLCGEAARLDATPGRFDPTRGSRALRDDLANAVAGHGIGWSPKGRGARRALKQALQMLHLIASDIEPVAIHE
ncbi:MAG: hypothetical protein AB7O32_18360 [Vicinamibacterales bacterium]